MVAQEILILFDFQILCAIFIANMKPVNIADFKEIVKECQTINELRSKTGVSWKRLKRLFIEHAISTKHFTPGLGRSTRGKTRFKAVKTCAFCKVEYAVNSIRANNKQQTCSYACSNKFFRVGERSGNWKSYENSPRKAAYYRRICFAKHSKKCAVCSETIAVDVHHLDNNPKNNTITNLIPLCANHHRYMHMKKVKHLIEDQLALYVKNIAS